MPQPKFRSAKPSDSSDLAILADMATRGLSLFLWQRDAAPGQSALGVGREAIRNADDGPAHHANWRVAMVSNRVAGGLNSYELAGATGSAVAGDVGRVLEPVQTLKNMAAGTYYLSVVSVFEEFRGKGIGRALLEHGENLAAQRECTRLSLLVGSFNETAKELYKKAGYKEWARREFVPFHLSDPGGEWILMRKDL